MIVVPSSLYLLWMAICNRARGSGIYDHVESTTLTRLIATFGMAFSTALWCQNILLVTVWLWASLMLWCVPAWDAYWSAAIGNDPKHTRLWGLNAMTLRQCLGIPALAGFCYLVGGNPWFIAFPVLYGLPYYIWGHVISQQNAVGPITYAEYTVGLLWGVAFLGIIG